MERVRLMQRIRFESPHKYNDSLQGWMYNQLNKVLWRVDEEYEELVSDAWLLYAALRVKYYRVSDKHFAALFRQSFRNHIHWLAYEKKEKRIPTFTLNEQKDRLLDEIESHDSFVERLFDMEAPKELLTFLEDGDIIDLAPQGFEDERETKAEAVARAVGVTVDRAKEIVKWVRVNLLNPA